jgi:hypothetical protein
MIFFLDEVDKITVGESHKSLLASFRRDVPADGLNWRPNGAGDAAPADVAYRSTHVLDASTSHVSMATRVARTWAVSTITERAPHH